MNLPQANIEFIPFEGGYDTETPPWRLKRGRVSDAQNFEIGVNGGYQDIAGYERFDGRSKPSDATYYTINVTITGSIAVGDTVTQLTSGATGVVIAVGTGSNPAYLALTKVTGTFDATHALQVSAVTQATAIGLAVEKGAPNTLLNAQYLNLAADSYRADIGAVTGSGDILGIWMLGSTWYAFRNNAGNTAAALYKSTTSGWTAVSLGRELSFTSGGTYTIAEGDTITGATSAATAVVSRVIVTSGSWAGGDAAGRLILSTQTGTLQAENLNVGANINVATIAGNSSAITLPAGGRYEFCNTTFSGTSTSERMYGVNGVGRAFEFDGTVFVPITTGMSSDTPTHVIEHKNHLFLSFGNLVQHSSLGQPYLWSVVTGAAALNAGDTISGFGKEPGDTSTSALGVYCRNRVKILYGSSASDWNLTELREEVGAYPYTIQQVGQTIAIDDRGLINLRTSDRYGNFQSDTLAPQVQRWLNEKRILAQASCLVRNKNQYRVFFSDQWSLYCTFSGPKLIGVMPCFLSHEVTCIASVEDSTGAEQIMFGSSNGYVYQMDKGTSFDGDAIAAFIVMHYDSLRSPRVKKHFTSAVVEARGTGYAAFDFSFALGYGEPDVPQPLSSAALLDFSSRSWDSGSWDIGNWDGRTLSPSRFKLGGDAENIALILRKSGDYYSPVCFSGALVRTLPRRGMR